MLLNILLVILVIDCVALVGVVLLQRSEGGALGMGGGSQSMFTARGAGDLLTRTTWILAWVFFGLAFAITMLSGFQRERASVVNRTDLSNIAGAAAPLPAAAPSDQAPASGAPPLPQSQAAPPLPGSAPAVAPPLPQSQSQAAPAAAPRRPAPVRRSAPAASPPPVVTTPPPAAASTPPATTPPTQNP